MEHPWDLFIVITNPGFRGNCLLLKTNDSESFLKPPTKSSATEESETLFSTMVRIVVLVGTILLLESRLVETLSPHCRCRNHSAKSSRFHKLKNHCELIPTQETVRKFNASITDRHKIFILLNITFTASDCERQISNSKNDCNHTDSTLNKVLFPYQWTWVYEGENGMYPLMEYPYDYNIHSLWTLNKTKVILNAVLTIPDNCVVTIGDASLFRMVFLSLNSMAQPMMKADWKGFLCYNIDNSQNVSGFSLLIHHYLGFVRGIAVKYCCPLQEMMPDVMEMETGGQDFKFCNGDVVPTTMLMDLTTILGGVMFLFLPFSLCFFLKEEPLLDIIPPDSAHEWINTNDGVFSFQHLMRWVLWWNHPSLTASRIRRILFILLSPFIVYYHIIAEYFCMSDIQTEYLNKNIPLGLKSVFFSFRQNYENTYGFLGGTLVWCPIYFSAAIFIICLPKNIGDAIIGRLALQKKSSFTFLILDAPTLKKYSSVDIRGHKNYQLAFEALKANLLMVSNCKFWIAIMVKWKVKIVNLWTGHDQNTCISKILFSVIINIFIMIIYIFVFLIEVLACFGYYGCPIIFTFISINVSVYDKIGIFWFNKISGRFHRVPDEVLWVLFLLSMLITLFIFIYIFLLMVYIYLSSFFILNLTIMFTLIGVIITPEYIGYLAYLMSAMFYINTIYQTFTTRYNALLNLVSKTPSIYVVNIKNIQFIRRDIFYEIVEQIRPLRTEIFILLSKYFLLFLYLSMSYNIIQQYKLSLQYTEKILSCLLITQVPKVAINILTQITSNSHQNEFNEQKTVKNILKKYTKNLVNDEQTAMIRFAETSGDRT